MRDDLALAHSTYEHLLSVTHVLELQVFLQSPAGSAAADLLLSTALEVVVGPPDLTQTLVSSAAFVHAPLTPSTHECMQLSTPAAVAACLPASSGSVGCQVAQGKTLN